MAIIVGPPGCGKSFAGAELACAILAVTNQTIFVVCFTNHALDQFLCHLLDQGEQRIVRIGGKSREERLDRFSLFRLKKEVHQGRNRAEKTRAWEIHTALDESRKKMTALYNELRRGLDLSWADAANLLADEDPHALEQLTVPHDADGFERLYKGRRVQKDFLWRQWKLGQKPDPFTEKAHNPLWKLSKAQRQLKLAGWVEEMLEEVREDLITERHKFDQLDAELSAMDTASERTVLQGARVIAATTTGSAKYRSIIESAAPGVLLLEEAGEVLEAHVISSLSASVKHVIMIGDHKQLRPKVETHNLTVAAKNGYNLNCSLFERLILGGLPHETLLTQHRMRTEISSIARYMTYPDLRDHADVLGRADVPGLASNVCFINHSHLEHGAVGDGLGFKSLSKVNGFEAELAVQVVQFLLLQGYRSDDIVVLTPYLGQLKVLNDMFQRHRIIATVGERDVDDLLNIGVDQPWLHQVGVSAKGVRTCTIDNYQGEEADVIITTLVRSNRMGQLGFLGKADAEQRVNVLCTRARYGMIFIGNAQCFLNATPRSPLWTRLLGLLQERGEIYEGLPIKCQQHAVLCKPCEVNTAERLRQWCAQGAGCGRPCDTLLRCGHVCPLKCHPWGHESVRCEQPIRQLCPAGIHHIERACSSEARPYCNHKVIEQCSEGHPLVRVCGDRKLPPCAVCKALEEAAHAHDKDRARRAQEVADLMKPHIELAAHSHDAGATEGMRDAAQLQLVALAQKHGDEQLKAERTLAVRLDEVTHAAQNAVQAAMLDLQDRKRLDEERLHARRLEHERQLGAVAERMEHQRAEQQRMAEADIAKRDEAMRTLQEALAANLENDKKAIEQVNADRADPEEVDRQLEHVRRSAKPVSCSICCEDLTILDGPLCQPVNGHFLCRECFDAHVIEEVSKPEFKGEVYCPCRPAPAGGCTSAAYPGAVIARHATPAAFDALARSRVALREREISEQMQREFDERLEAEKAKMQKLLADNASAAKARLQDAKKHIVDKILTLACPRCGQAFLDFEGCCALTCSRQGCGCGFCALCMKDCGTDAHKHVEKCGQIFMTLEALEARQTEHKRRKICEYLHDHEFREEVLQSCEPELRTNMLWPL